ncbi:MAG: hypothetical protein JST04_03075 [Bdellovibrionales bacterium]|nr:hypothetical protein [Bdellovibrionales bacterium]
MTGRIFLLTAALVVLAAGAGTARAEMSRSLLRSPEALAMGGAYTAIVEDRDAAFYNPAGVAAYDHLSVHYVNVDPTVSNWVVSGWKTLQDLKTVNGSTVNRFMGQNVFVQGTASTAVLAPGFALIGLYDVQGALYAKNQAFPKIEYGYQTTSGVQAAWGFSVKDGRMRGKGKHNDDFLNEWRFGIGAKYLARQGGYRLLSATELLQLNQNTDASTFIGGKGSGYGGDLGVQRIQRLTPTTSAYFGASYLNIGDVTFGNGADPIRGDFSIGTGLKFKQGLANVTVAYDIQQLNNSSSFGKKQNFGAKLGLPLLDIYAGLHQGFLTYGAAIDVWILRVAATVYREENGAYPKQDPEDRLAVRVDFKMDL